MNMEIIIKGAIVNAYEFTTEEFLNNLFQEDDSVEYYHLQPTGGGIVNACFDWAIIGNISDLLNIVAFIWMAYSKIKEKKANGEIIININVDNNAIRIGSEVTTKEELEKQIKSNKGNIVGDVVKDEIKAIKESPDWKHIK